MAHIYGGAVAQGYLQYLQAEQDRKNKESQLAESKLRQQMLQRQIAQDIQAQQFAQQVASAPGPQFGPPPTPQGPGQPSVPMQPLGQPRMLPPPPQGAAPPQGAPQPPVPPQQTGPQGPIQIPPQGMARPPAGAAPGGPPAPPQPFIDPSKLQAGEPPPGMQIPPPPEDQKQAAIDKVGAPPDPFQMYQNILGQLNKISPNDPNNSRIALAKVEQFKPIFDMEQKQELAQIKAQKQAADEARDFYKERLAALSQGEKVRHNEATEDIGRSKVKVDADREKRLKAAATGSGGGLSAEDTKFWAQYVRDGGTLPAGLGRGAQGGQVIQKIMHEVASGATGGEFTPGDMLANRADVAGTNAASRSISTQSIKMSTAAREAYGAADMVMQAAEGVTRTEVQPINSLIAKVAKGTGSPEEVRLAGAINAFVNTYSRAISPTGTPTVSDKEHARETLFGNFTTAQLGAAIDNAKQEMENAMKSAAGAGKEATDRLRAKDAPAAPKPGTVMDGYRFKGGDPGKKENWEKV